MRNSIKIIGKICLILSFFVITPFFSGFYELFMENKTNLFLEKILNPSIEFENFSVKEQLALLPDFNVVTFENPMIIEAPIIPKYQKPSQLKGKRVFIYSTHQSETFTDGTTIYETSIELAKRLKAKGFEVVVETHNFLQEADDLGMKYNELYAISRKYLNEAFVNYGGFDLIIDLHRDSAPRDVSVLKEGDIEYAKMMFVVGMKSANVQSIMSVSKTLTDKINAIKPGIMRSVFERNSVYNQDMNENMVLIELGSDTNSYQEVIHSLDILVEGLASKGE